MLPEILRNLVLALVLAYFIVRLGIASWTGAMEFGSVAWIGFPAMWKNVPWRLAGIYAGDWLTKLLLTALIHGLWQSVNA